MGSKTGGSTSHGNDDDNDYYGNEGDDNYGEGDLYGDQPYDYYGDEGYNDYEDEGYNDYGNDNDDWPSIMIFKSCQNEVTVSSLSPPYTRNISLVLFRYFRMFLTAVQ